MMTIIVAVAVILVIIAGSQLLKIAELRAQSKGELIYEVSEKEAKFQGILMLVFFISFMAFFAWQMCSWYGLRLPVSASVHGVDTDWLTGLTYIIITPTFILTNGILFFFCYKYSYSSTRKATFFSHSNKLEAAWTTAPALVLTVLILYGLSSWNAIMTPIPDETDHITIELTGQQFTWTARYAGEDKKLGRSHVTLIEGVNATGVDADDENAKDDKIVKGEFHLPIGMPVQFVFRSLDVLHSAYFPHFRSQMNCVPGITTQFNFIPTITTEEMRKITNNEKFNYVLLCNKICGAAHYNMQMDIVVESQEDYDKWLAEQKTFVE
ncbi:MAG: cytochrome C oxidase subunit II [Flavobacteriales bacterium]|nr:MAG: cytochrome C oxidase subunit II [Flavobacteriales bacterium]